MSSIDEVKDRLDIVDLVSETVQLRRSGKNYVGFCPFHPNTRTPAFVVFPETSTWRCFGQCNEGGDIFRFVMKREGWDFPEALRNLAERAGVQLRPLTPQEQVQKEEHEHLRALLEEAVTFFRHQLVDTLAGKGALEYLRARGLADETIEIFGLGYAPRSWDAGLKHFTDRGYPQEDLAAAGLLTVRDDDKVYDRFRHRVMFPIRDRRGRMAGFGARALAADDVPKYLNTAQTAIFDKGRLLFGLDRARRAIRASDQAVIVEGYMDVIALHQAGHANTVSPMGTALTEYQLRQLKRLTRRIVLALDADAAGNQATLRGLQVARRTLDREADPVFDARGLLRHEGRLQADIRVTTLPAGKDPDEVVQEDAQAWEGILEEARPIVLHVMETLAAGQDLEDPKIKQGIADQVLPLIEDLASPIERDTYYQRLARLLQVDERALMTERYPTARAGRGAPRRRRRTPAPAPEAEPEPAAGRRTLADTGAPQEAYCLGILLRRPELIYRTDRALQEAGLARLAVQDFQHSDHQVIFRLIVESLDQVQAEPVHFVLAKLPLDLMDLADEILARTEDLDLTQARVFRELLRSLLGVRRRNLNRSIDQLRFLMESAQEKGDIKARQFQELMSQHILARALIDKALQEQSHRSLLQD